MKPLKPVSQYAEDRYPSSEGAGFTRRGFVRVVFGGVGAAAVGVAAGAVTGSDEAEARRGRKLPGVARRPKLQSVIDLKPDFKLRGCKSAVASVTVRTYDHRLAAFIGDKKEHAGLHQAVVRVLAKHTCKDVTDAKRLSRLRRKLAAVLSERYHKRTKRNAGHLWIHLTLVPTTSS
jgi:hypothetical protein